MLDRQQFIELKIATENYYLETGDIQVLPLQALAHAHLDERQLALDSCAQADALLSDLDIDARIDLAAVYCLTHRVDDAVVLLEAALQHQSEHALAQARLAWCRMQTGQLDEARLLYLQSSQLAPDRLPVWNALARLCLQTGDITEAQLALNSAISQLEIIHDELPEPVVEQFISQFRGLQLEIWIAADENAQADQWLEQRQLTLPEDEWVNLITGYASLLANKDRHAQAEESLLNALKHYPKNLALIVQLSDLAQLQGRNMQATQ